MERDKLAKQLEVIGNILENERVVEQIGGVNEKMTIAQQNARIIKILSILIEDNKADADTLLCISTGKELEEIKALPDKKYATLLRRAILNEVLNFFG